MLRDLDPVPFRKPYRSLDGSYQLRGWGWIILIAVILTAGLYQLGQIIEGAL